MVINKYVKHGIKLMRESTFAPPKNQAPFFFNSPPKKPFVNTLAGSLKMLNAMNLNDTENRIKIDFTHTFR